MMRVSINHPTDRPNFTIVTVGDLDLAFSYRTVIGFCRFEGWVLSENLWSNTTGKHLNHLGDPDQRVPRSEFEARLWVELETLDG